METPILIGSVETGAASSAAGAAAASPAAGAAGAAGTAAVQPAINKPATSRSAKILCQDCMLGFLS
jgi:hypothetical protein